MIMKSVMVFLLMFLWCRYSKFLPFIYKSYLDIRGFKPKLHDAYWLEIFKALIDSDIQWAISREEVWSWLPSLPENGLSTWVLVWTKSLRKAIVYFISIKRKWFWYWFVLSDWRIMFLIKGSWTATNVYMSSNSDATVIPSCLLDTSII